MAFHFDKYQFLETIVQFFSNSAEYLTYSSQNPGSDFLCRHGEILVEIDMAQNFKHIFQDYVWVIYEINRNEVIDVPLGARN